MGKATIIKLYVSAEDMEHITALRKIVAAKKEQGRKGSLSHEILRTSKNGLLGTLTGAEVDRAVLLRKQP